jgi:hypothetical protein
VQRTSVEGTWDLVIDTPIGRQQAVLTLSTQDGALLGMARDLRHGEKVPLTGLVLDGDRLTWAQSIRRPMRLNLTFDVVVAGDEMSDRSKAGRLPSSRVTGHRVTRPGDDQPHSVGE